MVDKLEVTLLVQKFNFPDEVGDNLALEAA
jgi:hypothetical protein